MSDNQYFPRNQRIASDNNSHRSLAMSDKNSIYLDAIGFAVGSLRNSVQEAETQQLLLSPADILVESGFGFHRRCRDDESAYDLAARATEAIFSVADKDINERIDLLCYATCIPGNSNVGAHDAFVESGDVKYLMDFPVGHLQAQFNIERAQTFGLTQMACTSLLGAIRVGANMLLGENLSHCLCLTSDRFPLGAKYEQSFNLISDGAAGCILSRERGEFLYRGAHHITNGAMAQASDDETAGFFFNYSYRLIQETLEKLQLNLSDIHWIVPQNTNSKAWQVLASLLRYDLSRVLMPTRSEIGHCISGDNLINLHACLADKKFNVGDIVLLPMAGYGLNWSCIVLEKV